MKFNVIYMYLEIGIQKLVIIIFYIHKYRQEKGL